MISALVGVGCGAGDGPISAEAVLMNIEQTSPKASAAIIATHLDKSGPYPESIETGAFDDYFSFVGRVQLSDTVQIGAIRSLEVSSAGRLLVQEVGSPPRLYLFEPTGEFVRELRPEACVPDFEFRPVRARFFPSDDIIVANSNYQGGFGFDSDGRCVGRIDIGLELPRGVGVGAEFAVHLLRTDQDGLYLESFETERGSSRRHAIPTKFINIVTYVPISDVAADQGGSVFVSLPYSPTVLALHRGSSEFVNLGSAPDYYRPLPEDFKGDMQDLRTLMSEVDRLMYSSSYTEGLRFLDAQVLLLTYRNGYEDPAESPRAFGYQLVHTTGQVISSAPVYLPSVQGDSSVRGARDGLLYRLAESPEFDNGEIANSNPVLEVYRLTVALQE